MFPQRCDTAEGSFQAGTQKDFETLLLETGTRGYLYKMGYSEEDVKCIEEEEAAAAAVKPGLSARMKTQAGLSWSELVVRCMYGSAIEIEIESLHCDEF